MSIIVEQPATSFSDAERAECKRLLFWGLSEDLGDEGDITSRAVIPVSLKGSAVIVARAPGVIAGLPALTQLATMHAGGVAVTLLRDDGRIEAGDVAARLAGPVRGILAIERLALNLLGRLSGVATLTAAFVEAVAGTKAVICDTRKTTPGWRRLEKYAVRVGGGTNHRLALHDAVLIKDNHLAGLAQQSNQPIRHAVDLARTAAPEGVPIEVEVDTLAQLDEALAARPDVVLLDNMTLDDLREAVARRNRAASSVKLEASGGIRLTNVAEVAATGVDRISVGALTHSAVALDLALDFQTT